ncbi:MAG: translational GTPase TypA [Bdellovibrionales bacterium]|nr:translational GTPase TypA [Bdellovibrionales bacterium]
MKPNIRNIAIIAHVDHGKTTLVDQMFRQSGVFREGALVAERLMDNLDLERERGITITAKNCAVSWQGTKINIVDTPGHADFGGEVERALSMVDGAILLVDASEGPLPQTRFVLEKALAKRLPIIVVVNKIDRSDARAKEVLNDVYDLFIDLDANDAQIEFPVLYAIGRDGIAQTSLEEPGKDLRPLFDTLLEQIPPPEIQDAPFRMLVSNIGYSDFVGRLAIGKVESGVLKKNQQIICLKESEEVSLKVTRIQVYAGTELVDSEKAEAGDIAVIAGLEEVEIGDTLAAPENKKALPRPIIDEPTVAMRFYANDSPFAGKEGKHILATRIQQRLEKECLANVALDLDFPPERDSFIVMGRGEFQMVILLETMRREGFEVAVGRPEILFKERNGEKVEPIELLHIDVEETFVGILTEKLSRRKGRLENLTNHGTGRVRMEFSIPSRGLIGFQSEFMTDTKGTGIMHSLVSGYEPYRGDFRSRFTGSLVSDRVGSSVPYALYNLEPRGRLFVDGGVPVYNGMVVGEHNRDNDLMVNPCKTKKLTNMRASGKDEAVVLTAITPMNLEQSIEFIRDDELVEVTPTSIRIRKRKLPPPKST